MSIEREAFEHIRQIAWGAVGAKYHATADEALVEIHEYAKKQAARAQDAEPVEFEDYDAGLLNDWGGGNVAWWQDYLRAEIERANEHWREQTGPLPMYTRPPAANQGVPDGWLHEVKAERKRQDEKWGGPEHDDQHRPDFFVQLIQDYAGWSRVMAGMGSFEKFRRRMIQVAALAGAAVEATDRAIGRASGPIETGGECCCGETEEAWRICPEHGPTPPQPMEDE